GAVGNSGSIKLTTSNLSISNGGQINDGTFGKGNGGTITINASESMTIDGTTPDGQFSSAILNFVGTGALGNSGNINLTTPNLSISNGGSINAGTFGEGDGGDITINASESITLDGISPNGQFSSGIGNQVNQGAIGNSGNAVITTSNLSISNGAEISASTEGNGDAGDLTFNISDRLTLEENSLISAQAFGTDTSGGNIVINAQDGFVVAFPSQNAGIGNDIVANSPAGIDGNIEIYAQGVFGLTEKDAISLNNQLVNNTNDIDASGTFSSSVPIVYITSEVQDLPPIISSEQTTEQACQANREAAAQNGLVVNGKGGIPAPPDQPLTSQNLLINGEITSASAIPEPIETSKGKIQLARGIKVSEDGRVILTAYPTNNAGERLPEGRTNCGQI
ncbi:MAG: filamentous hemagglutinin N-terminal domain-containing protein, partial [Waterburya sp.]